VGSSASKNTSSIQPVLDDLSYEELTSKSNATEKDVDELFIRPTTDNKPIIIN